MSTEGSFNMPLHERRIVRLACGSSAPDPLEVWRRRGGGRSSASSAPETLHEARGLGCALRVPRVCPEGGAKISLRGKLGGD